MAASNLFLIHSQSKSKASARPFGTYYYQYPTDKGDNWHRSGHAASATGALRAAVTKMVENGFARIDIFDQDEFMIYQVMNMGKGNIKIKRV